MYFNSLCMCWYTCTHVFAYEWGHACITTGLWISENNLRCWSLLLTLFEMGSCPQEYKPGKVSHDPVERFFYSLPNSLLEQCYCRNRLTYPNLHWSRDLISGPHGCSKTHIVFLVIWIEANLSLQNDYEYEFL